MTCETVQAALEAARVPGDASEPAVREHLAGCADCRAHAALLRALPLALAAEPPAAPAPAVVARARVRALRALRAHAPPPPAPSLGRELARALGVLSLALPFTIVHAWLLAAGAAALLGGLVPPLLLEGLGIAYFGSLAVAVGALFALLPLWIATVRRGRLETA